MAKETQGRFMVMGKNIFGILNKILQNQDLLKLIKYTDKDPLSHDDLNQNEIDEMIGKNILFTPVIPDEEQQAESFLTILFENYQINENIDFKDATLRFDIICPSNTWVINDSELRPFKIMQIIDGMVNGARLEGIGNLQFRESNVIIPSAYHAGYMMEYGHQEFN